MPRFIDTKIKRVFFTSEGDAMYRDVVPKMRARFEKFNECELRVISEKDRIEKYKIGKGYWAKCLLWDLAPDADMVGWIDGDIIPVKPFDFFFDGLALCIDFPQTAADIALKLNTGFPRGYYNDGVFTATRQMKPLFDDWKQMHSKWPTNELMPLSEQTCLSLLLSNTKYLKSPLCRMPNEFNWLVENQAVHSDVVHVHYAGGPPVKDRMRADWKKLGE